MRRRPAGDGVTEQGRACDEWLLRHTDDACGRDDGPLAGVGLRFSGQDAQQGRLARAIAADQAGPGAGLQRQVHPVEQQDRAVAQAGILQRQDGRTAHCAGSAGVSCAARANSADRVW